MACEVLLADRHIHNFLLILLIASDLIWAPLPNWLPWRTIGALTVLVLGIYNLFR